MSRPALTPTSYAILGLLAIRPWSSYELTKQMDRSLGHMWPRAASKLYEEPKKLVDHGLARSSKERTGKRNRTVYRVTAKGRRELAAWLSEPGAPPVLEFEQLVQIFFADHGRSEDALETLRAAEDWARRRSAESAEIGREYLAGEGPFPERVAVRQITARFLNEYYALVASWAAWAQDVVETWPDDPGRARPDRSILEETVRISEEASRKRPSEP